MKLRSIYRAIYKNVVCHGNPLKYARKIGVNMKGIVHIYGDVVWGSEPWIISLGNNVHITNGVRFLTHDGGVLIFRSRVPDLEVTKPITVGDNVYFGNNALIMPGVNIGDNVVIGAGAIVTHDIPNDSVAVGVPARVIKSADEYLEKLQRESIHLGHLSGAEKDKAIMEYYGYKGNSKGVFF